MTNEAHNKNLPAEAHLAPMANIGFGTGEGYALMQRVGNMLAASDLVPQRYRNNMPNCVIALDMANRLGANPLMVMQNLYVVHGTPAWSAQFMIATFNQNKAFSAIRYEFKGDEGSDEWSCRACATEKASGEVLTGSWISIGLAKKEGWYGKSGSKWQTMPQQMLMYRAAAWFIRAYAPEISMGIQTAEEVRDTIDMEPDADGGYSVPNQTPSAEELNDKLLGDLDSGGDDPQPEEQEEAPKRNRPTKEEMEQRRADARATWESTGQPIEDAQKAVNEFSDKWNTAQCEKIVAMAQEINEQAAA